MSKKFPLGYEVDNYINEALKRLKETYPWVTLELFDKSHKYKIEKENNRYKYIAYYEWYGGLDRDEFKTSDEFIEKIMGDNSWSIERANPEVDIFKVPIECGIEIHGWYLEKYEFRTHVKGGYSSYIQAGDRVTGGSREFFIPPKYFAKTFDEFLDNYLELVPANHFGLDKEYLKNVKGLKEFLGY